jgi:hypothetical protein
MRHATVDKNPSGDDFRSLTRYSLDVNFFFFQLIYILIISKVLSSEYIARLLFHWLLKNKTLTITEIKGKKQQQQKLGISHVM